MKRKETTVYHVVTRVVAGQMLLEAGAKEVLRRMLWQVAEFSGVDVIAYCIMTNHLHILVRVPEVREEDVSRTELLRRYALIYGEGYAGVFPDASNMAVILAEDSEEAARWEARLRARMNDVSAFMKTLKQRFSWWYNRTHKRFGTLWAERFKSVLVEDDPAALQVVAAYIDLNPVRAGLVEDPEHYRWSSYGEAMGGERRAQRGLASAHGPGAWSVVVADYRMVLYGKGGQGRAGEQGAIPHERVIEVLAAGGTVPLSELLRCRVRYMTEGAILGSAGFVQSVGCDQIADQGQVAAAQRSLGRLPTEGAGALMSWRRLRVRPIQ